MPTEGLVPLLQSLRDATVHDLEQPRYEGAPIFPAHRPGFLYFLHRRHERGLGESRTSASGLVVMAEHSGTHIDALCHQAVDMQLFGGRAVDAQVQSTTGFTELGVETIEPIVARGILIDVARHRGTDRIPPGEAIEGGELSDAAEAQGVSVASGDVVLVRTGNGARWPDPDDYLRGAGMASSASEWLAQRGVLAVGADNVAWDPVGPVGPDGGTLPGHVVLIVRHGIYIIENLLLEGIATAGAQEFLFVCLPLKMLGVTGSPVRPLAIVPATDRA
jgi:kynurenine formamidase